MLRLRLHRQKIIVILVIRTLARLQRVEISLPHRRPQQGKPRMFGVSHLLGNLSQSVSRMQNGKGTESG